MTRPRPRGPWLVAGALGLWLVAWWVWTAWLLPSREQGEGSVYVAAGYLDAVSLYLRHDWLEFDPVSETVTLAPDLEGTAVERFYRESYLARDVAAFNDGDLSVFRIENGRILAIDPHRRNAVLPFADLRDWRGRLTYRPAARRRAELAGAGVTIELLAPAGPPGPGEPVPTATLAGRGREPDAMRRVRGEAVNLVGEGGVYLGQARLMGDAVVFNYRNQASGAEVSVSGEAVPVGNRVRLASGDLLKLTWRLGGTESTYALLSATVTEDAPVISSYRASNGSWRRWPPDTQPPAPADPAWTEDAVAALDAALRRRDADGGYRVPTTGAPESVDVALTLDAALQAELERRLADYVRGKRGADEPPGRAAVTVMDAVTGELLALASYPRPQDLPGGPGASRMSGRLGRNHNFSRLPIGSVAKVPFTAAILDAAPLLAGLEIPAYAGGDTEELLGLELAPPLRDHAVWGGEDGRVGLEDYLEDSSNRYAALLLTLATGVTDDGTALRPPVDATAEPLPPEQRFYLNGVEVDRRPRLALPVEAPRRPGDPERVGIVTRLELQPFARRMGELFDVAVSRKRVRSDDPDGGTEVRRPPGTGDDLTDTAPWKPLLSLLYGEDIPLDHPFYGVSPERTHLAFNLVDDYRREYLSLILGGGNSTWTNPHVASVFARLATGRRVSPRLVARLRLAGEDVEGEGDAPGELGMDDAVRQRLLDGLTRVAGPSGTAGRLAGPLRELDERLAARDAVLGFFSKTGSPDVVTFEPTRTARALDELIRVGALRTDGSGRIVYRDAGVVDADVTDTAAAETGSRRALDALLANAADREILARHRVGPGSVIRAVDTYNDARPEDRGRLFETAADGRLVRALNVRTSESVGAAFAFVAARYPAAARRAPAVSGAPPRVDVVGFQPERAYAVSIIIEGLGNGPRAAVPFAREILDEMLAEELLGDE